MGDTALCVSVGLDFEEIIIHGFIKAQINLLYKYSAIL